MAQPGAVPMIVMTSSQDHVEAVNSTLRQAGHRSHCSWISDIRDLADGLTQINPELLVVFTDEGIGDLGSVMKIRNQFAPAVPVVVAREQIDEAVIAEAMQLGAQDVISLSNRNRLQAVIGRELRAFRLDRALNATLESARETKQQLQAFMAGSADAIAHIAEGIIVNVNPAWMELFGYSDADDLTGQPLMDLFETDGHTALKGALVACMQGKWTGHTLRANALLSDGSSLPLELEFSKAEFDGDPCVRVCVPSKRDKGDTALVQELKDAVRHDATTGVLHWRYFLEDLKEALSEPVKGGLRYLAHIKPDKFASIRNDVGVLRCEEFLASLAAQIREQLAPKDLIGRMAGNAFVVLLHRGNQRDMEAWAAQLLARIGKHVFQVGEKSFSVTCSISLCLAPAVGENGERQIGTALDELVQAGKKARGAGGNRVEIVDNADADTRTQAHDKVWVKHIKTALMENRFRLVQQPIASLQGEDKGMFDVLVRMVDEQGKEVLPSEFMAAAERNDLMKNIDRWVIGASMSFCAARKPNCVFVRLSRDTVLDKSLSPWLQTQLKSARTEPARMCFQITEETAAQYVNQTRDLLKALKSLGFRTALEHFGTGRDPLSLLTGLPLDFIKIDSALMQGLASNQGLQQKVQDLVEAAQQRKIETIAEQVEDANTMAVLWQLGIEFIQGYFVNAPEAVVIGS